MRRAAAGLVCLRLLFFVLLSRGGSRWVVGFYQDIPRRTPTLVVDGAFWALRVYVVHSLGEGAPASETVVRLPYVYQCIFELASQRCGVSEVPTTRDIAESTTGA